jgi:hypothetical protein
MIDFFKSLPTTKQYTWAIYTIVLEKEEDTSILYIRSGTYTVSTSTIKGSSLYNLSRSPLIKDILLVYSLLRPFSIVSLSVISDYSLSP